MRQDFLREKEKSRLGRLRGMKGSRKCHTIPVNQKSQLLKKCIEEEEEGIEEERGRKKERGYREREREREACGNKVPVTGSNK